MMKTIILLIGMSLISLVHYSQAEIYMPESIHYFDTLNQGDRCEHYFYVRNGGDEPLIISWAKTACGCDVATWPHEPIEPNGYAFIKYKYDSKRLGPFNKSMTIQSNDPDNPVIVIRVKGVVRPIAE